MRRHIIHFVRNDRGMPVGCIAFRDHSVNSSEYTVNNDECLIEYGYSTHNPVDKWNRRVAREVAIGRMEKNPIVFRVTTSFKLNISALIDKIYIDLQNRDIPRISKEAKREVDYIMGISEDFNNSDWFGYDLCSGIYKSFNSDVCSSATLDNCEIRT